MDAAEGRLIVRAGHNLTQRKTQEGIVTTEPTMFCRGCNRQRPWTPFERCSWECYDQDRDDPAEHQAMQLAAPQAFAFFMGPASGWQADDPST
ncbi:hypothetical protein DN069_17415 [Streptacidiphilus pinicola]|uniref:Uncharacterized protein n=1 Tax=Streptacidiphilus pinicola TaxID=2219663 RepID=A0A2X0IL13_9ACTN|nr:hypothetical protein [Streptacidiphilus pinicola]RAG84273.1 hypothetical protein DN069_17415 [Streptacidiphilus pinicola]